MQKYNKKKNCIISVSKQDISQWEICCNSNVLPLCPKPCLTLDKYFLGEIELYLAIVCSVRLFLIFYVLKPWELYKEICVQLLIYLFESQSRWKTSFIVIQIMATLFLQMVWCNKPPCGPQNW